MLVFTGSPAFAGDDETSFHSPTSLGGSGRLDLGAFGARLLDDGRVAVGRARLVGHAGELLARLLRLALAVPHAGIEPIRGKELMVRAALDDHAPVEHDDLVGADDGGKA